MQNTLTLPERHLIARVPELPPAARILVAGNRSGELPCVLSARFPDAELKVHVFDAHHARQVSSRLREAGLDPADRVVCTADLPEGPWPLAFFQTTPRSMSAELVLDQLQHLCLALAEGGALYAAFEGDPDEALRTMKQVFAKVNVLAREKTGAIFRAVRRGPPVKTRDFAARWTASVPGGPVCEFLSWPGCFCHRRADPGGLALAETAARELAEHPRTAPCILDMGCGAGFVGLLALARADAAARLVAVDSHARAIAAARHNADALGCAARCRFVLSDDGLPAADAGTCDLALANPPYYGDWRIAELFLRTAHAALKPGGVCLAVAKSPKGLLEILQPLFGDVETIPRRGYAVLRAVR